MMNFKLTNETLQLGHRQFPYAELLLARYYHRPEQRLETAAGFRFHLHSLSANTVTGVWVDPVRGTLIPGKISADAGEMKITIQAAGIVEPRGLQWRLMELTALPRLMESKRSDRGAFLVGDFSGALMNFDGQAPGKSRSRIYTAQEEWEKFGMFNACGILAPGKSLLTIVDQGDFFAWCDTEFDGQGNNRQSIAFGMRHTPEEVISHEPRTLICRCCTQDDFPALARLYRDYLLWNRGIVPLRDRVCHNETLRYQASAMFFKIFFGQKSPFLPDGSGAYRNCTTFAEAEEILDSVYAQGIRRAVVILVGWNAGGHDGSYPTRFPVNAQAGGEDALRRLIDHALKLEYQIVPHDNVTDIYLNAPDFSDNYVSRDPYGMPQAAGLWAGGVSFKACPTVAMERYSGDFDKIYELGFRGAYYLDAQTTGLFRCTDSRHPADERTFAEALAAILQLPREQFGAVSCELAAAYTLPFTDQAAHIPGQHTFEKMTPRLSPDYVRRITRIVPFYQIAVHGIITYTDTDLRRIAGFGALPAMELARRTISIGDDWREKPRELAECTRILTEKCPGIYTAFIEDFSETATGAIVRYDDGTEVHVADNNIKIYHKKELIWQKEIAS